ncbi:TetR/AcrR family transcriptional regulator [Microbacterium sp.]|uniref:TetR/AcrR family transcriptional regulator n=1 Tax=Microbacterium sp. TaxID=51671 RepID=UPI0039E4AD4F
MTDRPAEHAPGSPPAAGSGAEPASAPGSARRRGAVRSETARMAVLHATAAQLAERGWDGLTIEGIAAAAGVGKPTIYRWWPSKSALVADAMLEGLVRPLELLEPVPVDTGDLHADLAAWLEAVLQATADHEATAITRYMVAAAAEDAIVGHRLDEQNHASRTLRDRIERGSAQLAPGADVDAIVEALTGAILLRVLRRAPYAPGVADALVRTVLPAAG